MPSNEPAVKIYGIGIWFSEGNMTFTVKDALAGEILALVFLKRKKYIDGKVLWLFGDFGFVLNPKKSVW